jgi:hypothetical protein
MKKLLTLTLLISGLCFSAIAQDTIVVQTLTFEDITKRRDIWEFPTGETFRKILMVHTLKCDPQTTHDQFPCGEWDYLTYNIVHFHTGEYDSTLLFHPNFTLASGRTVDTLLLSSNPQHKYFNHSHSQVSYPDTLYYHSVVAGAGDALTAEVFPTPGHSGRSQYLWKADELNGLGEGWITGIKLNVEPGSAPLAHVMVRMALSELEELTPANLVNVSDTVFYNPLDFAAGSCNINFYQPFYWNGISNIIIDFGFTDLNSPEPLTLSGQQTSFNSGIFSGGSKHALDFDGRSDFLKIPPDTYFNSNFTFSTWLYKRSNNNWSRIFDFGNGPNINNVIIALSQGTSGKLSFHINNDFQNKSWTLEEPLVPLNEWTHITLRLTNQVGWVYFNGEFVKHIALQQPQNINRSINYIGRSNWPNDGYANMLLDEFTIYNVALDPATIHANFRKGIENPQDDPNLILYYKFDEEDEHQIIDHSSYGHHATAYGLPFRYPVHGPEIYLDFQQSNIRPLVEFVRIESSSILVVTQNVYDSIPDSPLQIILYGDPDEPALVTDTVYYWEAGWRYVYENWQKLDSVWVAPDTILVKENLPYYSEPFEIIENFEIGRFITPYGINLDLGPNGFSWVYDVTDYAPLLQGMVDLSAGNQQELIDLKFIMIQGIPPREVLQIDRIWGGLKSHYFKDIADDLVYSAKTLELLPNASEFRVKTRLTGHGHYSNDGSYPHCCEWKDNEHYLLVNGEQIANWYIFQYEECGLNPVYPQGGTWPGAREGWCPGDMVHDHDFEITEYVEGNSVSVDYDIEPVPPDNLGMGWGNYVTNFDLIQYGETHFEVDAEVYDVITPSSSDYYSRKNPICYDPHILIRNNGTAVLNTLHFEYGVSGGEMQTYNWTGSIKPHHRDTIVLPVTSEGFWFGDTLRQFTVNISNPNGQADQYADNDSYTTRFTLPDQYNHPVIVRLKTNNQAWRYSLEVRDVSGNVLVSRNNLENNTIYNDTINLPDGCYTIELLDEAAMGLTYWAYPAQGNGYLRLFNHEGQLIKNFNSDFGRSIFYTFSIGNVLYIAEPNLDNLISIYPNPFTDEVFVDFEDIYGHAQVSVYDMAGRQIYKQEVNMHETGNYRIDLPGKAPGMYLVRIVHGDKSIQKKIIKK